MLIYRDDVIEWNAVDVLIDCQLHYGRVINVAETGLVIDFQCPERRSQLVAYGSIFRCDKYLGRPTTHAQVLLRRHPAGAWIWYPGRVVPVDSYCYDDFELVEVQRPYGTVTEFLPWQQVRSPTSREEDMRLVEKGDFVIRSCPVPGAFVPSEGPMLSEAFNREMARRNGALFTGVLNQELLYLYRQTSNPIPVGLVESVCINAAKMNNKASTPDTTALPPCSNLGLPPVLLVEIFQSLDSIERIRCRRVCAVWNTLLTTQAYFPDVRVSSDSADYGAGKFPGDEVYWVAACLLKCLSSATRRVMVSQLQLYDARQLSAPIHRILKPGRLPVLVFHDCDVGGRTDRIQEVITRTVDLVAQCACDRVVWKNCRLADDNLTALVSYHSMDAQSRQGMEVQLWEVFERNLLLKKPLDRQAVENWIIDCIPGVYSSDGLSEEGRMILKALNEYQSADPRQSTRYRQRAWTPFNIVDVDVRQLTTLTVTFINEHLHPAPSKPRVL
ncbi:uncharacterized protein LOC129601739 [Paramacrobiotus metropolitanus]|uniref:uncharacterized protein LOC129601739 n=1 Tax=Paramacrobiotus metropolitanus TaxID=2943436 RepID=UPI002446315D|nr:uncharacterized protein LOC129601739 [Paramacrobiotus metropolitanus]